MHSKFKASTKLYLKINELCEDIIEITVWNPCNDFLAEDKQVI